MNAADVILQAGGLRAQAPALIVYPALAPAPPRQLSHADLALLIERAATVLLDAGVNPGDRVGLVMNDSEYWCAAFLGAIKVGAVPMALNTRLAVEHYRFIAQDSSAALWLVEDTLVATVGAAIGAVPRLGMLGRRAFEQACAAAPGGAPSHPCDPAAPAFWLYSSGTTGHPKGIVHSHASCAASGMLLRDVIGLPAGSLILATSKLFFAFALDNALLGALSIGATTILNEAWAETDSVFAQVKQHQPQLVMSVPTFYRRLLALPADDLKPFAAVNYFYTGGERVPDSVSQGWTERTGRALASCYGMSETYSNVLANYPRRERDGSCGQLLPGVSARLLDTHGDAVNAGEPGLLWLQHPTMTVGYHRPEFTQRAFKDGWFCTHDLFRCDEQGYFWHEGRADELLKVAGQWVKPGEVEEAALASGVLTEAACVVAPDEQGFDRLALFVVPISGVTDVLNRIETTLVERLPRHCRPKWLRLSVELPRNPTGKVQRFVLREALLAERVAPVHLPS